MSIFRTRLRQYITDLMGQRDRLVITDVTDEFVQAHPELVDSYARQLVQRAIAQHMKELCTLDDKGGQASLLDGLPVGIVVADGVIKPRAKCTWTDLEAGLVERDENIRNAQERKRRYVEAMDRLGPHMRDKPKVTVEQVAARMGEAA